MLKKNEQRLINLLSMAMRARKVAAGAVAVEQAIAKGTACAVLVAADASSGAKDKYKRMTAKKGILYYEILDKEELGHCIGKEYRAAVAVSDKGFARKISEIMEDLSME